MKVACLLLLGAVCFVYGERRFVSEPEDRSITGAIQGIKNFFMSEVTTIKPAKPYKPYPMYRPYGYYKPHTKPEKPTKPIKIPIPIPIPVPKPNKPAPIRIRVQVANIQDETSLNGSKGSKGFLGNVLREPSKPTGGSYKPESRVVRAAEANGDTDAAQLAKNDNTPNVTHNHSNHGDTNADKNVGSKDSPSAQRSTRSTHHSDMLDGIRGLDGGDFVTQMGNAIVSANPEKHKPYVVKSYVDPEILELGAALLGKAPEVEVIRLGNTIAKSPSSGSSTFVTKL